MEKTPFPDSGDSPEQPAGERLDSWKEIAAYLKRDIKTVQRWERTEGLPVRRHPHLKRGSVYAFRPELDVWWNDGHARLEAIEAAKAKGGHGSWWQPSKTLLLRFGPGLAVVVALLAALAGLNVGGLREWLFPSGGPAPKIDSIAVLPLKNLMKDPEQEYFIEGMHEALITELSKISALKVISRTSAVQYKHAEKPMPQIARELGVEGLIEGSVMHEGDHVRINVQLIHGPTDRHLWAESFDREIRSILGVQSDVARAIAREIRVAVRPAEGARLAATRPVNPDAYMAYLRGRFYLNQRALGPALKFFQQAIEIDSTFALAHAGVADSYNLMNIWAAVAPHEAAPKARTAALRALELDETLAEAHAALAHHKFIYEWNWAGAERSYKRALELNPNYAPVHHWYAIYLDAMGRFEEALAINQRALELDPHAWMRSAAGGVFMSLRQYDTAIEHMRKALAADPDFLPARGGLVHAYVEQGKFQEAIAEAEWVGRASGNSTGSYYLRAYANARAGRKREAQELLAELRSRSRQQYVPETTFARIYAALGEKEQALAWLEAGFAHRDVPLRYLKVDPQWDSLRDEPRFQDLLRRMNFPE